MHQNVMVLARISLIWLAAMALLIVLARAARHSPEVQLARSFGQELQQRRLQGDSTELGMDP